MVQIGRNWEFERRYTRFRPEANQVAIRHQGQDIEVIVAALWAAAHRHGIEGLVAEGELRDAAHRISRSEPPGL